MGWYPFPVGPLEKSTGRRCTLDSWSVLITFARASTKYTYSVLRYGIHGALASVPQRECVGIPGPSRPFRILRTRLFYHLAFSRSPRRQLLYVRVAQSDDGEDPTGPTAYSL